MCVGVGWWRAIQPLCASCKLAIQAWASNLGYNLGLVENVALLRSCASTGRVKTQGGTKRSAPSALVCIPVASKPLQVLRIDEAGKTRKIYVRRRDLLRTYGLQPRDLRRIDPSLSPTRTAPSVTVKDSVLVVNMGGVRCVSKLPLSPSRQP